MQSIREPEVMKLLSGCIHKYGALGHLPRTLEQRTLRFSRLREFNDIHEYEYRITHYFDSIESEKELLEPAIGPFERIRRMADGHLDRMRVSCFTRSPLNALMWAHYADDHRGICYSFQGSKEAPVIAEANVRSGNVMYSSHVPELKIFQERTSEAMLKAQLDDVILTKSSDWAYEQEVRFFGEFETEAINFSAAALKAVIVGRRVTDEQINELKGTVADFNAANGCDVRILFSHRLANSFQFGVDSNKGYRDSCETNFAAGIPVLPGLLDEPITSVAKARNV